MLKQSKEQRAQLRKERAKKWREANKEYCKAKARETYRRDPDAARDATYKWRQANKEKWRAYMREYMRNRRHTDDEFRRRTNEHSTRSYAALLKERKKQEQD